MMSWNRVAGRWNDVARHAKAAWHKLCARPSRPCENTPRALRQSRDDEDRARGEGMGQAKYGPPSARRAS